MYYSTQITYCGSTDADTKDDYRNPKYTKERSVKREHESPNEWFFIGFLEQHKTYLATVASYGRYDEENEE